MGFFLRGQGARFKMRGAADSGLAEWGDLDTALEGQFNLIASYVVLVIECGAVSSWPLAPLRPWRPC